MRTARIAARRGPLGWSAARALVLALLCAGPPTAAAWGATPVAASPYPSKPIRLVVTSASGSPPDVLGRWLAERLSPALGVPIVVDDRPGAGGNLAMQATTRSAPDGYTLVIAGQGPFALNPHLYAKPGYDPIGGFAPITQLERGPLLLVVDPELPVHSVADLIALAAAKPGALSFGSPGIGTPPHLAAELFNRRAGLAAVHVPYGSAPAAMVDLVAGRIGFTFGAINAQLPQVRAGKARAIAVTSATRLELLPDVPTVAESGLPGFAYESWIGIAAPAGTPLPIVDRLQREIARILLADDARAYFASYGREPAATTPAAFAAFIRAEHAAWGPVIRGAGIRPE